MITSNTYDKRLSRFGHCPFPHAQGNGGTNYTQDVLSLFMIHVVLLCSIDCYTPFYIVLKGHLNW